MSVSLNIIMPNNYGFEHNEIFATELLDKIKKLNFEKCRNYEGAIDNSPYEFFLDFCPTHLDESIITKSIDIVTPTSYGFFVSEKGVSISTSNRYSFIYENYQNESFNDFRNDLIKIADLFNANEWFYMADNIAKIAIFETDLMENLSYQQSKENLLKKFGAPITDFKKLDYSNLDYEKTKDWFFDSKV